MHKQVSFVPMFQIRVPRRRCFSAAAASEGKKRQSSSLLHCRAGEAAHGAAEGVVFSFRGDEGRRRKRESPAKKDGQRT